MYAINTKLGPSKSYWSTYMRLALKIAHFFGRMPQHYFHLQHANASTKAYSSGMPSYSAYPKAKFMFCKH